MSIKRLVIVISQVKCAPQAHGPDSFWPDLRLMGTKQLTPAENAALVDERVDAVEPFGAVHAASLEKPHDNTLLALFDDRRLIDTGADQRLSRPFAPELRARSVALSPQSR
jgi:hypothetical protein